VVFSPKGGIASGGLDGTVKIWDPANGQELASRKKHHNRVEDLAFSPNGSRLASAAVDGIMVWDVAALLGKAN
jgi:WD40 repeat protein